MLIYALANAMINAYKDIINTLKKLIRHIHIKKFSLVVVLTGPNSGHKSQNVNSKYSTF